MIFKNDYNQIKRYVITTLLAVSALFALFEGYFSAAIDIPDNWYISAIFIALILVVEMTTDVKQLENEFTNVVEESGWSRVDVYPSYEEFYDNLSSSVEQANKSLYLTHVRNESPDEFDAESTRQYFNKLERWCENNPSGQVKRVTTLSNDRMVKWGEELSEMTNEVNNFYVRVCNWDLGFPFINFAIVDDSEIYIALTSDTAQETKGIRIRDEEVVSAFVGYFDHMWMNSTKIGVQVSKVEIE